MKILCYFLLNARLYILLTSTGKMGSVEEGFMIPLPQVKKCGGGHFSFVLHLIASMTGQIIVIYSSQTKRHLKFKICAWVENGAAVHF